MKKDSNKSTVITILVVVAAALIALAALLFKPEITINAVYGEISSNRKGVTITPYPEASPTSAETTLTPTSSEMQATQGAAENTATPSPAQENGTPTPTRENGTPTPAANTPTPVPQNTPTPAANTPTPTPSGAGNTEAGGYYGQLKVVGTHLTDSTGKSVQLRGISTHGLQWFPQYVNKAAFSEYQRWGTNVVRLAMYTAENGYCDGDAAQKARLKKLVNEGVQYATELDMYVIIDWHILSDNNPNMHKDESKAFFEEMSKKYAGDPHVLYEICNEPNGSTSWADVKKYAEEIIPVIKKNSPDAVIIVGTPTWSQDVDQAAANPITGYSNIMYALHFYASSQYHQDSLRNKCENAAKAGLPIFVTEYGTCEETGNGTVDTGKADKWIALLNKYGISFVNWSLSNKAESASIFKSSCNKSSGFTQDDLTESGRWLVKTLGGAGAESYVIPTSTPAPTRDPSATATPTPAENPGSDVVYSVDEVLEKAGSDINFSVASAWGTTLQLNIEIVNNSSSPENNWTRTIKLKPGVKAEISGGWCAKYSISGNTITIKPEDYNSTVPANGKVTGIGLQLTFE